MPEINRDSPGRWRRMLAMALPFLVVFPAAAEAHLFHTVFEFRDNQLTKDSLLVLRLVEFPDENFAMAEAVYLGEQRLRLKPGGFRTWLRRPLEPGMVFKADYQMHRGSGSVATECRRLDHDYGTMRRRRPKCSTSSACASCAR